LKSRARTTTPDCGRKRRSRPNGDAPVKLPLMVWFWAAHLMATTQWLSAVQLEAQLGITYKTVYCWREADDR
jgi:hypothetical protein